MTRETAAIAKRACDLMEADLNLPLRAAVAIAESVPEDEWDDVLGYVAETTKHLEQKG